MAGITEWIIISIFAVVLLAIYIWPHLKKKPQETKAETSQPAGDTKNLKDDAAKSGIYFLVTTPATVIYFWQAPKLLCWLIEPITLPWAYVISALLFVPIIGIAHYLWGEHWDIGKKGRGFALVALVALVISLLYIYYPEKVDNDDKSPAPAAQAQTKILWQESYTFNQVDDVWFPDHVLEAGEKVTYIVEYNSIKQLQGTGEEVELKPGIYHRTIKTRGAPNFFGATNKPAKITVKKCG